jgi:hypothetical protein
MNLRKTLSDVLPLRVCYLLVEKGASHHRFLLLLNHSYQWLITASILTLILFINIPILIGTFCAKFSIGHWAFRNKTFFDSTLRGRLCFLLSLLTV